jgi:hypothetical protein
MSPEVECNVADAVARRDQVDESGGAVLKHGYGQLLYPLLHSASGPAAQVGELYQTFAGLPPDRFPHLAAHAAQMVAGDADERFRFAIDVVIHGVIASAVRR